MQFTEPRLSPEQLTSHLDDETAARRFVAMRTTLAGWTDLLRHEAGDGWPMKVTAFRPGMMVHGRFW